MVGVKKRIQRFDVVVMGVNADGGLNIGREHCTPIS